MHHVVSSENEKLILVDQADNELGYMSKADCHDGDGILHRAFSIFLFDAQGRLLLQQRGQAKRLWPGYWSNSCCSHPRKGETLEVATRRRLEEELGIATALESVYQFSYRASFGEAGSEHELCTVFLGHCADDVRANPTEIAATRLLSADQLQLELEDGPDAFTPWFRQEWECLRSRHQEKLAGYLAARD